MKRFLMVLALGGAMFAGCGDDDDDDDDDVTDAGDGGVRPDGSVTDGGMDAARPDGGSDAGRDGGGLVCGTQVCSSFSNATGATFAAVCVKNAANQDVCGLSTEPLGGTAAGYPAALERNAPGVASATCGAFYDSLEPADGGTRGNGRINSTVMVGTSALPISYPGCCTAKGFCSGDTNMAKVVFGGSEMDTNANFGCMESTAFFRTAPAAVRMIPCNVTTGVIIPAMPGDAGVGDGGINVADAGGMDSGL